MSIARSIIRAITRPLLASITNPLSAFSPGQVSGGNTDDFSTDTTSLYTMTQDSGTPSAAIASGVLTITCGAGNQAVFTRNGTSIQDGYVEADIDFHNDGGLVFRFQSNSTYYLLAAADDTGNGVYNLRLYKKVTGTFTQLGSDVNIAWPRGTQKTVRLSANGSAIKAFVDGVEQISVTDSAITAAGKVGMRGNGPSGTIENKFNAFRWS